MFTTDELKQLSAKGIEFEIVERQLEFFRKGFPFLQLERAATVGDGILQLTDDEIDNLVSSYEKNLEKRKVFKFVPASGAATRMFKDLYDFINSNRKIANNREQEVFDHLQAFAFYPALKQIMDKQQISATDYKKIAAAVLLHDGLNYGNLPKGLLLFHKYSDGVRTAIEEHLVEGANYAINADNSVNLHFTVSPEHQQEFEALINSKLDYYSEKYNIHYNISFSQQKSSTDTIAVDLDDIPIRNADGSLLFRPGGHGALLENLNEIDADLIFIKNIDNVAPDKLKPATIRYKKALAGLALELQKQTYNYYRQLLDINHNNELIQNILDFLTKQLSFQPPSTFPTLTYDEKIAFLLKTLNRPIRVCGMVKNEGEPGGGPFWVRNSDGSTSLQIAETSQINLDIQQQFDLVANATHFNPVDLVCAVKDCDGNHYNLLDFRDLNTGFISLKFKDGVELKAQELPGLWNGAMAHWNTIFVEVPVETFNPVKTINDLLRTQHQ